MEVPSRNESHFGDALASGDGIAYQTGVNNGTININREFHSTDDLDKPLLNATEMTKNIILPKIASNATFDAANKDAVPSCLPGTRVDVLKDIQFWIDGDNPNKVYWLNGMAGTGKSTIALTLARTYRCAMGAKNSQINVRLGATFFFSRGGGDLSSASKFPATIAIQLAETSVELRKLIEDVIENNPRLDSLGVRTQWEKLIIEPLSLLSQSSTNRKTLLLIVDALDECDNAGDTNAIIRCLEQTTQIKGLRCRVFLTSRPEQSIKLGMNDSTSIPRENFVLHNIDQWIVDQDLTLYYRDQLSGIKATISAEDIISERTIQKLVERSNGLFIHAATVCRLVRDGRLVAVERLSHLLETQKADSAELELDRMYTVVLDYSFGSVTEGLTPNEVERVHQLFQRVIGAIIVMFDVMSSESLARLLGVKIERIITTLNALHSVIDVPEHHSEPIRILHPSFREFLLDPNRCTDNFYCIMVSDAHGHLLTRCFASMTSQLQRNILDISKPGAKAQDMSVARINSRISKELQYSSKYWWNHFQNSDDHSRTELSFLEFLESKYLSWLECLAWLGKLGHAIEAMLNMDAILAGNSLRSGFSSWMTFNYRKQKRAEQLHAFVPDALQFLLSNKLVIEEAPLQIYVSALIFSPNSNEVRKRYSKEIPSWILNEPRVPDDSSKSSRELAIAPSSVIHSVAISPDSSLVATACGDCLIHIWDTLNGAERFTLEGNPTGVAAVCFSPDGGLVASFVENNISVWNIQVALGTRCQPEYQFRFRRRGNTRASTPHPVCAISPNGHLVTVVDHPHDIWVWDMRVKQSVKYHFQIQSSFLVITGVCFSSDGSLLFANEGRKLDPKHHYNLHAWDTLTGTKVLTEDRFHSWKRSRSMDGRPFLGIMPGTKYITIAPGGSNSGTHLVIRDARTDLETMRIPLGPEIPVKVHCKPRDGKFLLASIVGSGILVWVLGEHRKTTTLKTDPSGIISVDFSPNGKYLISANSSNELRIWDIEYSGSKPSRLMELYQGLEELGSNLDRRLGMTLNTNQAYSPSNGLGRWHEAHDGSLLATGAHKASTISILDTEIGEERFCVNIPKEDVHWAFFRSDNIFAVITEAGVHSWETKTGQKRGILKLGGRVNLLSGDLKIFGKGRVIFWLPDRVGRQTSRSFYVWDFDGLRKFPSFRIPVRSHKAPEIELSPSEELYCLWDKGSAVIEVGSFSSNTLRHTALREVPRKIGFMPDGKHIWILSHLDDGRQKVIHIWDIEQEDPKEVYIDLHPGFTCDRCDNDDSYLEKARNKYEATINGTRYTGGFVSPDGELVALVCPEFHHFEIDLCKIAVLESFFRPKLEHLSFIRFTPSGTRIIAERKEILLPETLSPPSLQFTSRYWIHEDGEDILAIPLAYRNSFKGINGHTIRFRNRENRAMFVRLDKGVKTMTA